VAAKDRKEPKTSEKTALCIERTVDDDVEDRYFEQGGWAERWKTAIII